MVTLRTLTLAGSIIQRYEERYRASAGRADRVFVQVEKSHLLCLLQLARAGLLVFERSSKAGR